MSVVLLFMNNRTTDLLLERSDTLLNTPLRPAPCAPRLPKEDLGPLAMPLMRGARMGCPKASYGAGTL